MLFAFTLLAAMVASASAQTFYWSNWNRGNDCFNENRCADDTLAYTIDRCFASTDDWGVPVFAKMTFAEGLQSRVVISFYPLEDSQCTVPRDQYTYDLDTCNFFYCTNNGFPCAELVSRNMPTCSPGLSLVWVIVIVLLSLGCFFGVWRFVKRQRIARAAAMADSRRSAQPTYAAAQPTYVAVGQQQVVAQPAYNQYTQPTHPQGAQPIYQAQQQYVPPHQNPPQYQQQQYQAYNPVQKPQ